MDTSSQGIRVVGIVLSGQDPAVRGALTVQPLEVAAILGQHGTVQRMSASEDIRVGSSQAAVFLGRQDIMPKLA